jgi:hypothetical protein
MHIHHNTTKPPIALSNNISQFHLLGHLHGHAINQSRNRNSPYLHVACTSGIAEYEYISGTVTTAPDITYAGGAVKRLH